MCFSGVRTRMEPYPTTGNSHSHFSCTHYQRPCCLLSLLPMPGTLGHCRLLGQGWVWCLLWGDWPPVPFWPAYIHVMPWSHLSSWLALTPCLNESWKPGDINPCDGQPPPPLYAVIFLPHGVRARVLTSQGSDLPGWLSELMLLVLFSLISKIFKSSLWLNKEFSTYPSL